MHLLKQRHALHLHSVPAAQQDHPLNLNQPAGQLQHQRQSSVVMSQEPPGSVPPRLVLPLSALPSLPLLRTGPLDQALLYKDRLPEHLLALMPLVAQRHSKQPVIRTRRLDPSIGQEGRRPRLIVLALLPVPERRARLHQPG